MRLISPDELDQLAAIDHGDPHAILGVHPGNDARGRDVVAFRAFHPEATGCELRFDGSSDGHKMKRIHEGGIFEVVLPNSDVPSNPYRYRYVLTFEDGNTWVRRDPYRFLPTLGDLDLYLAGEGTH